MKESLKSKLNTLIKLRGGGMVSLREVYQVCDQFQYKYENATRRLRQSESPDVLPVWNSKRTAIIGYRWKPSDTVAQFLKEFPSKTARITATTGQLF